MNHSSRFGYRPVSNVAAFVTDDFDQYESDPVETSLPDGPINHGQYKGFGSTIDLKPGLSVWQGILTTTDSHYNFDTICASESKAHFLLRERGGSFLNKISKINAYLRHGVIAPYGYPYGSMTPDTVGDASLVVGFDAEWIEEADKRRVLSYQLAMPVQGLPGVWFISVYFLPRSGRRYSLGRMMGHFLRSADAAGVLSSRLPRFRQRSKRSERSKSVLTITLAGHYTLVDVTTLFKGSNMLRHLDTIRKSEVSIEKPLAVSLIDHQRHELPALIFLRDSLVLAADRTPLSSLGQAIGLPKIDLPNGYDKSRMDVLLRDRPDAFMIYSAVDAIITLEWMRQIEAFARKHAPDRCDVVAPPTLGSLSASMTRTFIMSGLGETRVEVFDERWRGLVTIRDKEMTSSGKLKQIKRLEPGPALQITDSLWRFGFYGGRNEGFGHGIHYPRRSNFFWDHDVKNAYVAAMALIRDIDWSEMPRQIPAGKLRPGEFGPCDYFIGTIRFRFPPDTEVPCIPVKDNAGRGLIFPLRGQCVATAPEICLALKLGAEIEVLSGYVHPVRPGPESLRLAVSVFISERANAKAKYGKGSVQEILWKLLGNSTYGKIGQGLRDKRNYNTRTDNISAVPPSSITCAAYASLITALVRALVSAAIAELIARGFTVLSVTTDGFVTDADAEVMKTVEAFGFVRLLSDARVEVTGERDVIWECKHAARSMVMGRTRAGFGVGNVDGYDLPIAAAGYSEQNVDKERIAAGEELGEILARKFVERNQLFGGDYTKLPSPREYVRNKADGIGKTVFRKVNWNYDFKRAPDIATLTDAEIFDGLYVSYLTHPHDTLEDFQAMREDHDNMRAIMKSSCEVGDFLHRHKARSLIASAGIRRASLIKGGMRRTAAMHILRGIRSGMIIVRAAMEGPAICDAVSTAFGVQISPDDWKNAGRRPAKFVLTSAMLEPLITLSSILKVTDWKLWSSIDDQKAYLDSITNISNKLS